MVLEESLFLAVGLSGDACTAVVVTAVVGLEDESEMMFPARTVAVDATDCLARLISDFALVVALRVSNDSEGKEGSDGGTASVADRLTVAP